VNATISPPAAPTETLAEQLCREGWVTLDAIAERAGVRRATVLAWVKNGVRGKRLEAVRVGRNYRSSWPAFSRFLTD
jgi:hypothetical protein